MKKDTPSDTVISEKIELSCTTIAQGEHPITPDMLDRDALFVLTKLRKAGFSGYLVGGGVRDLYLGKKPKDFDISTNARPGQLRKLFPNSNTIGRRFRLVQVFFKGNKTIEVSTLRSLSEHDLDGPEAILAPNNTFGTLDEDAQRRDLTINSLFYEIEDHSIIDYVGGVDDLEKGIVRMVGDPRKRFTRDPVRMMRAVRHCARNDFEVEEVTWAAIIEQHEQLSLCPPSRLRDEFLKDLYSGKSSPWFELAAQSQIFTELFKSYKGLLDEPFEGETTCREQLSILFSTIDRMNLQAQANRVPRQPDYFLLALVLIPWAEVNFKLISEQLKGSAAFQLGKKIRTDLDKNLGIELNLRRSLRQEITTLLINLPLFIIHDKGEDKWPKWLQKKSYFKKCLLFYQYFTNASVEVVPEEIVAPQPVEEVVEPLPQASPAPQQKRNSRSSKDKIALTCSREGGIFGFRKSL